LESAVPRLALVSTLLLAPALNLCALEESDIKDAGGKAVLHYAIEAPKDAPPATETDPAKQLGLFLCFHEHDGKAADEMPTVLKSLARLKLADRFVVIGVNHVEHAYSKADREHTVELIEWAKKTYAINPRRIYDFGKGEGATMSAEFALAHPELIAAAITYSWGFRFMPDAKNPLTELPGLYIVIGLADTPTHIPRVRETYAQAKPHGYQMLYHEVAGLTGNTNHPATNDDAIAWAISQRNKVLPLAPRELALLKPIASASAAHGLAASDEVMAGIALVGGLQAGSLIGPLFDAKDEAMRLLAIRSAEVSNYGEIAMAALARKLKDPSAEIRKAAITALGVNAHWRSATAQEALVLFAGTASKTSEIEERALAIDAIGQALKLEVTAYQQDIVLFKALVGLLDDDSDVLRARAFAVLQPALASDYKPEADKATRKTALAAWQTWLGGIAAKEAADSGDGKKKK
jgi:hypothetical protein